MGATTDYVVYKTNDRDKIEKDFAGACQEAKHQDGVSYPGTIAAMSTVGSWVDRKFDTEQDAIDYLVDNHEKWEEAMAVSFKLPKEPSPEDKKALESAQARVDKTKTRLQESGKKILDGFFAAKSAYVGCKKCKSRLRRGLLKDRFENWHRMSVDCPLCGDNLLSPTVQNRVESLHKSVEKAVKAFEEIDRKASTGEDDSKIGWVVGGWCSS